MKGTLYGIGVGPGDPELLTMKAHRILTGAKVVAYPAPDSGESFAHSIVAQFLNADQIEIPIIVPMRVERFPAKSVYDQAASEIASHLDSGADVVVLCEGDPFFYGSFMYLFERLAGDYPCEVVPGISSLMASSAVLGRPLAARNDVLTIVPAPSDDETIETALTQADALAFIKVGRHLERVAGLINRAGLTGQAAYLERVTLDNQKIMPLSAVDEGAAPYFSIILVYKGAEDWIAALPIDGLAQ
ncbi:precorrin-2 C(20)-methyltransferase [Pseudahrensia aquimaris]|uniref:Precorrin-2 C(20)-methyltransferase n=1 Tax=Pseudahrensia aquimaris TaxID=744461 RepID=A0ABW3FLK5_9HYPH